MSDGSVSFNLNTNIMMQSIKDMTNTINKTLKDSSKEMKVISSEFSNISQDINKATNDLVSAVNALNSGFKSSLKGLENTTKNIKKGATSEGTGFKRPDSGVGFSPVDDSGNVLKNFSIVDKAGDIIPGMDTGFKSKLGARVGEIGNVLEDAGGNIFLAVRNKVMNSMNKEISPEDSILGKITGIMNKRMIINMALDVARSVKDIVADSLQVASDIEETQNVVSNTFKQHMGDMEEFAQSSIRTMGISSLKAKQYASTYKSMMSGLTMINEDTKTELSKTLTGMAADIGSFFSSTMDTDEAFEMLKAPLDKQSLKVAKIGVNMTQESLEEWGKNYGIMYKDLSLQEQTLMRIAFIMDQTSVAQGDFIKNSNSWHNQLELIRNKMVEIKGIIGAVFIDLLKPALTFINNILDVFLSKINGVIDIIYKRLGRERPEIEIPENKGVIGEGYDISQQLMEPEEKSVEEPEEKQRDNKKELDVLGIDNLAMLKTDYTDPEKEKDRKAQSNQFDKVYDLLQENMNKRDKAIEKAMRERNEEKSPLFYIVKEFFEEFKDLFGGNFEDIFEGIGEIYKGIKKFIGDASSSFFEKSIEIGTKDLIDKITNEMKEIGGVIGEILGVGEDEEVKTIGDVVGRMLAYYVKITLSKIYIFLKILNAVLTLLRDTGLLVIIAEGMELLLAGISGAMDLIVKLLEMITKPIIDPEGTAFEDVKRDEEFQEMRESGEYGTWDLIRESLAKNTRKQFNQVVAAFPDALKLMTGNREKTYMEQLRQRERELDMFGTIERDELIKRQGSRLLGSDGSSGDNEVVNNINVSIDGREVQAYVEEEQRRRRRTAGVR